MKYMPYCCCGTSTYVGLGKQLVHCYCLRVQSAASFIWTKTVFIETNDLLKGSSWRRLRRHCNKSAPQTNLDYSREQLMGAYGALQQLVSWFISEFVQRMPKVVCPPAVNHENKWGKNSLRSNYYRVSKKLTGVRHFSITLTGKHQFARWLVGGEEVRSKKLLMCRTTEGLNVEPCGAEEQHLHI